MARFDDLGVSVGDTVMPAADCAMRGVAIAVPAENKTHMVSVFGAYVAIENRDGRIKAWHTGQCFGDPDKWELVT